jgi:hypothetical protein
MQCTPERGSAFRLVSVVATDGALCRPGSAEPTDSRSPRADRSRAMLELHALRPRLGSGPHVTASPESWQHLRNDAPKMRVILL